MTASTNIRPDNPEESANTRLIIVLLTGQRFFYAFAMALLGVTAYSLFLIDFGSEFYPYVLLLVMMVVSSASYGFSELEKRLGLSTMAITTSGLFVAIAFLGGIGLVVANLRGLSFALVIVFDLVLLLGGIIQGMQAGRLLNVRQMKRLYPIISAGMPAGLMGGALSIPLFLQLFNQTEYLLFVSGISLLLAFLFTLITFSQFRPALATAKHSDRVPTRKPLPQLLRKRYVLLLFLYQISSAVGTQLIVYIYLNQAEVVYLIEEDLTQFLGNLLIIRNLISTVFVATIAGILLNRFGIAFGLLANPIAVAAFVMVMTIIGTVSEIDPTLFLWLAVGVSVIDAMLSDGTTVTGITSAYQALPKDEQVTVQAGVEGIGIPVAFGITGVCILIINAFPNLTLIHVLYFTVVVCILWATAALWSYRDYAGVLLHTLSRSALGEVELSLAEGSSLAIVKGLVHSNDLYQVRLALNVLEKAEHETLIPNLTRLIDHAEPTIRAEALSQVARMQLQVALPAVEKRVELETDPTAKGAAIQALCALTESEAVDLVPDEYLDDPEPDIRLGAMAGLLRYGGISGVLTAGLPLNFLVESFEPEERAFAAQVIGAVGLHGFYHPLLSLLEDEDISVRQSALTAAGQVKHKRLLPLVIENLADTTTRAAAMSALISSGTVVLPLVDQALAENELRYSQDILRRLVHVCSQIKGEQVITLLKQHLDYPDSEVHYQILFALNLCNFHISENEQNRFELALRNLAEYGTQVLTTKQLIGTSEDLTSLMGALDAELKQVRQRIFLLLSFAYERLAMLKAEIQIARGSRAEQALAIETLDVTLSKEHRELIVPLIDDSLSLSQRATSLRQIFQLPELSREQLLKEMITDGKRWPQDWTRACAIQASAKLGLSDLSEAIENSLILSDSVVRETAVWALYNLVPDRFEQIRSTLAGDSDPQVAHVVNQLS